MSSVLGWLLDETARQELLSLFPPVYPDVIAHHVTVQAKAPASIPLPSARAAGFAIQGRTGGDDLYAWKVPRGPAPLLRLSPSAAW